VSGETKVRYDANARTRTRFATAQLRTAVVGDTHHARSRQESREVVRLLGRFEDTRPLLRYEAKRDENRERVCESNPRESSCGAFGSAEIVVQQDVSYG
jgi:hypothetical protein